MKDSSLSRAARFSDAPQVSDSSAGMMKGPSSEGGPTDRDSMPCGEELIEDRSGCLFCDIVAGRRPALIVDRDERSLVLLDKAPLSRGHCLVIPSKHVRTFPELELDEMAAVTSKAQSLSQIIPEVLGVDGCLIACNVVVSQSVPHVHLHVVPRRRRDLLLLRVLLRLVPRLGAGLAARDAALATLLGQALAERRARGSGSREQPLGNESPSLGARCQGEAFRES